MKEVISIANCKKYSKKIHKEDKIDFGNDYSDDPQLNIMCKAFMEINNKRECLAFIRECPEPFMKKIGKGSVHVKNEVTVESTLACIVLSLKGRRDSAKLISFPSFAYLIKLEAIIAAKLSTLESVPNALTIDYIIIF